MSRSRFFCVPKAVGRGAGLANELIPWAKACLAAHAIDGHCLHPAWGMNPRRYWRHFGTSRLDFAAYRLLELIYPVVITFNERAYRANYDPDFGQAFANWVHSLRLPRFVPVVFLLEGMWGGLGALDRSRPFLLSQLYRSASTLTNIMAKMPAAGRSRRVRVGIHYRSGDFKGTFYPGDGQGRWNRRLPLSWYIEICCELKAALDPEFVLVTDAPRAECELIMDAVQPITTFDQDMTDVSDLLLLSQCDCIVPSLSSFSLAAIWLGSAAYIWPGEHAVELSSFLTLWGDEEQTRDEKCGETARNIRTVRAEPEMARYSRAFVRYTGRPLSAEFLEMLRQHSLFAQSCTDLIRYGVLPTCPDDYVLQDGEPEIAELVNREES